MNVKITKQDIPDPVWDVPDLENKKGYGSDHNTQIRNAENTHKENIFVTKMKQNILCTGIWLFLKFKMTIFSVRPNENTPILLSDIALAANICHTSFSFVHCISLLFFYFLVGYACFHWLDTLGTRILNIHCFHLSFNIPPS